MERGGFHPPLITLKKYNNMDYSKMTTEEIDKLIKIFQDLFDGKYDPLSEHNRAKILQELRDAKLEHILNR